MGEKVWDLAISLGFTLIPDDGILDGGQPYTDEEMSLMAYDYICLVLETEGNK